MIQMQESQSGLTSVLLAPQAMTNSATVTANLDTRGADYAEITVNLSAEVNTNAIGPTLSLLESDDTVVTNFATVVADVTAKDITAATFHQWHVDSRQVRKRYLRLSVSTETTTNDDVTVGATAQLYRQDEGLAQSTNLVVVV
tara:strand:+ start:120 stop:548 length:429 start_codon:yes stop_codon:yes gene_type:complete